MKRRLIPLVAALLWMTLPQSARALDPGKALTQYVHTSWRTDDGLPQNSITRILQTRDGFLWIGTQAGLSRFDGVRFTNFDHTNTAVFEDDFITDLVEDRAGTLWIATSNDGVFTYRDGRFARFAGVGVRGGLSLAVDEADGVWMAGYDGLYHVIRGAVAKRYTVADGLGSNQLRRVVIGPDKAVWFGTLAGLHRLHDGKVQVFTHADGLPNDEVTGLFVTAGVLWIKTRNAELAAWRNGRFVPWKIDGVAGGTVRDVLVDRRGNFWIGSGSEGLLRYRNRHVARFTAKDGLTGDLVSCLYEDRAGNLWVGTTAGGLDRFRDGSFTTYAKEEGLSSDQANAVIEDRAGDTWVTTSAGLDRLRGNTIGKIEADDPALDAWAMWEDHRDRLLVGTSSGGVRRVEDGRLAALLSERDGIPGYHVSAIVEDRRRQLWLATRGGGVARVRDVGTTLFNTTDGLGSDVVYALAEGPDGVAWIGTASGLNSIRDGKVASYPGAGKLVGAMVIALYFDSRQVLWIGTFGRGLFRLEGGRFTRYTTAQGLKDDTVNSIVEDQERNLWIGTDHLVARIARADLDAVAAGSRQAMTPMLFGKRDGMKSAETTGGSHPSAWRARDGRLWFPTNRGVVVVDPARLALDTQAPDARIEALSVDDHPLDVVGQLRLSPGTRRLEITYTAPNLSAPERTQFRYRLDGFDEQWVAGGAQRVANYTNMAPGHYTFRVNARIESGAWSKHEATLGFDLQPQLHQTWWFRLLCGLVLLSLAWAAYRLRVGWLNARAAVMEERQRIGSEIHDSLAQGLSGIMFQTEAALLGMPPGPAATRIAAAHQMAISSLDDARYSVWNLSPPVLDQKDLAESIPSMARQLAHGRIDDLEINFSGHAWPMRAEANHHVVMIVQEAISNAIQHGHAGTVVVTVRHAPDALLVSVVDDGDGFTPEATTPLRERGYGMRNMRHRAAHLGAVLDVSSAPGAGTRISLQVPRVGRLARLWQLLLGRNIARIDA